MSADNPGHDITIPKKKRYSVPRSRVILYEERRKYSLWPRNEISAAGREETYGWMAGGVNTVDRNFRMKKAETDGQIHEISKLAEMIWNEHFTPIIGKAQVDYMVEKFQSYSALKGQISDGYEYYQIFDNGEFCGYTGIHPDGDGRLFLSKLYIKKEARGRRLATGAFEFLKELCRQRGYTAVWLTCNRQNENTLGVYRHLGFETIDTRKTDIGGGFIMDDYIMEYKVL